MKSDVPALDRGLDILELVSSRKSISYSEMMDGVLMPTASAARIVKRLVQRGYLAKDESGAYILGDEVQNLMTAQSEAEILCQVGGPLLTQLRDSIQQTAILFYWSGMNWECIAKAGHEDSITMQTVGEKRVDIFGYPWSVFAYIQLQKEDRQLVLNKDIPKMNTARKHYEKDGYVIYRGDVFSRITVPVFKQSGDLLGALAMGITAPSLEGVGEARIAEKLFAAKDTIEQQLWRMLDD